MTSPPAVIPIIVDSPRRDPGLGFDRYVTAIAAAILGGSPPQYTVGLYGPWGTGKSSILMALKPELEQAGDKVEVVIFDAWRHERVANLLGPLIFTIKEAVGDSRNLTERFTKIFGGLEISAFGFGVRVPSDGDRGKEVGLVKEYMDSVAALSELGKNLGDVERVVVLIDDLDRCSPDRVIEVIESIRLLVDVPGFVFVLAIDYGVLIEAVRHKYPHSDPHRFIEKIVQVPFRIPNIDPAAERFMTQLVPDWDALRSTWFPEFDDQEIRSLISIALRDNPRQTKRLLNSFMVARHIEWVSLTDSSIKVRMVLTLLAMQLRWPGLFDDLMSAMDRRHRDSSHEGISPVLSSLDVYGQWWREKDEEPLADRDLGSFLEKHLRPELPLSSLEDAMRLASDVTAVDGAPTAPDALRRDFSERVLALLVPPDERFTVEADAQAGRGVLRYRGEPLVQLTDIVSVRQSFVVKLYDRPPHGFASITEIIQRREGKHTYMTFSANSNQSVDDILADAARLIEQVAEDWAS